jgi:phage-related protein
MRATSPQSWRALPGCGTASAIASPSPSHSANGLFELRHIGKLNTRVLWFFMKGRRIVAVHGIRNKGQAIPGREIDLARARMSDWLERKSE